MKIVETGQYKNELKKIALNIKKDKPNASVSFVRNLRTQIQDIPNFPYKYRKSFYFENNNIRDMTYKGYTVIYEIGDTTIEIFEIFNQNLPTIQTNNKKEKIIMEILPAIDLKDGKAVRLSKGLMESAKIYSDEPWQVAKRFEELGSKWLHIVDLNGAFAGEPANLEQIKKIRENCNLKIELGGGIRDEETIKMYVELGVDRLILGSIAVKNPQFVKDMAALYPIAVGIDAMNGMVAVEGWAEVSTMKATDLAKEFANAGVEAIICTDISKDGMLCGVNVEWTQEIALASGVDTIASGGVKDINDIINCKKNGNIAGCIVGKAFYEGTLDLEEAFKVIKA